MALKKINKEYYKFISSSLSLTPKKFKFGIVYTLYSDRLNSIEVGFAENENVLKNNEADMVAVGKGAIANPNLPNDIRSNKELSEFVPEMIRPLATIENTRNWKKNNI